MREVTARLRESSKKGQTRNMSDLVIDPWRTLIARRREQLDMSQRELAHAAGVAEKTIYNLEAGVNPRGVTLRKVLNALGLAHEPEVARQQVMEADSAAYVEMAEHRLGLAVDREGNDAELDNFVDQLKQLLELLPRYKRREVMDQVLNDTLRIIRRTQAQSSSPKQGDVYLAMPSFVDELNEADADKVRAILVEVKSARDEGRPPRIVIDDDLVRLTSEHARQVRADFELIAAHDEEHDIEDEQGHPEHP